MENESGKTRRAVIIGRILLVVSFGIALTMIRRGSFVDEADNLVLGSLMAHGRILYRDLFSHHFPFPYIWMMGIVKLFGKSIIISRVSVLLFQWIILGIVMELCGWHLLIGFTAFFWAFLRVFYFGHMVIYTSFSSVALFGIFCLVFQQLNKEPVKIKSGWFFTGILGSIVVLSDPRLLPLLATAFCFQLLKNWKMALKAGAMTIGILVINALYLVWTESMSAFYSDAILFNKDVYSRFSGNSIFKLHLLKRYLISGLKIRSTVFPVTSMFHLDISNANTVSQWVFSGLFLRMGVLISISFMVIRREYLRAIYVYFFIAWLLAIYGHNFRLQSYILLALFLSISLVSHRKVNAQSIIRKVQKPISGLVLICFVVMGFWLSFTIGSNYSNFTNYYLKNEMSRADLIAKMTCDCSDLHLAHYPGGIYTNWLTDIEPVAGYAYMWPWVADVFLKKVIDSLSQQDYHAIVICEKQQTWKRFQSEVYLSNLNSFLHENYIEIENSVYISPALFADCKEYYHVKE